VKGGFEVRIAGLRAFCPLSQIDLRWPKEPKDYVGQTHNFKILEFKERGRNIIVSRRSLLEEERDQLREELKETVVAGAVVHGTVRSVQDFGAFVDLGGVDALIPVSEMGWGRVERPTDVLGEGQAVTAKVLAVDWDRDRVSLSLKALQEDPWQGVSEKYRPGQRVHGTVARLAPFGAFVTLEPGVDGLVHISALGAGRRVRHPQEVLEPGEEVETEILALDPDSRRISLSLEHRYLESLGELPDANEVLEGTVEKVADFGVFVKIPSGHTGLVPNVEMGTPKGTNHSQMFRPGDPMEVLVLGVEEGGRRIRLSRKGVTRGQEEQTMREYGSTQSQGTGSFGTLGDLLRDKLEKK
jgi:small subunit ribosomal protein S1